MGTEAINLNRLAYFAAVVDTGSFTKAAERLGITKAVVSQQVARLEQETGASLLVRTTRRVTPTEAGRILHARCVMILQEAENAFDELAQNRLEPSGILRLTAPNDYGAAIVVPVAAAFGKRYPDCQVHMTLSDQRLDMQSGEWDLSIRMGWLTDSSLQARRIGTFRQYLVGTPTLAAALTSADPADLVHLPFIANEALGDPLLWQFSRHDLERRSVRMRQVMAINSTPAVLQAVKAGAGMAVIPDALVQDALVSGELVQLLPDWQLPSGGIYTVYPAMRFRPAKVVRFVEMLMEAEQQRSGMRLTI